MCQNNSTQGAQFSADAAQSIAQSIPGLLAGGGGVRQSNNIFVYCHIFL
jgi:hypothetical protein